MGGVACHPGRMYSVSGSPAFSSLRATQVGVTTESTDYFKFKDDNTTHS